MTDQASRSFAPIPAPQRKDPVHGARSTTRLDPAGIALLLFSGLNLNGIILLYTHVQAQFSPLILALSFVLCLRYARAPGSLYILFFVFIASYLTCGMLFSLSDYREIDYTFVRMYSA